MTTHPRCLPLWSLSSAVHGLATAETHRPVDQVEHQKHHREYDQEHVIDLGAKLYTNKKVDLVANAASILGIVNYQCKEHSEQNWILILSTHDVTKWKSGIIVCDNPNKSTYLKLKLI